MSQFLKYNHSAELLLRDRLAIPPRRSVSEHHLVEHKDEEKDGYLCMLLSSK
jgi:hypothetical protein